MAACRPDWREHPSLDDFAMTMEPPDAVIAGPRVVSRPLADFPAPRGSTNETMASVSGTHSWASTPASRRVMQGNRSRDTRPELAVRRLLHAGGLRYRVAYRPLSTMRRTADIVFTKQRIAVFIDGCFWHSCPDHGQARTKQNADYWIAKFQRNRDRDAETNRLLEAAGWQVLRIWEHETPAQAAATVRAAVDAGRDASRLARRSSSPAATSPCPARAARSS